MIQLNNHSNAEKGKKERKKASLPWCATTQRSIHVLEVAKLGCSTISVYPSIMYQKICTELSFSF
jgi:hypothetical protein